MTSSFTALAPVNPQALTIAGTFPDYTITGGFDANEETASVTFRATGAGIYAGTTLERVFSLAKSKAGAAGVSPALLTIASTDQAIRYSKADVLITGDVTLTPRRTNSSAAIMYRLISADGTQHGGSDQTAQQLASNFGSSFSTPGNDVLVLKSAFLSNVFGNPTYGGVLRVSVYLQGSTTITDTITLIKVKDGADGVSGYSLLLSNENHTVPADSNGNVTSYAGASTNVKVLHGSSDVTSLFSLDYPSNPQALAVNSSGFPNLVVTGGLDASEDSAALTIRMTGTAAHAGVSLSKVFSLGKSKAGADGSSPPLITLSADKDSALYNGNDEYVGGSIKFTAIRQNIPGTGTFFQIIRISDGTVLSANTSENYAGSSSEYFAGSGGDILVMTALAVSDFIAAHGTFRVVAYRDDYAPTDSITIARVKDGGQNYKLIDIGFASFPTIDSFAGIGGNNWVNKARTDKAYRTAHVSGMLTVAVGMGLDPSPGGTGSYTNVDYWFHRASDGYIYLYRQGAASLLIADPDASTPTVPSGPFEMLSDGSRIRLYHKGVELALSAAQSALFDTEPLYGVFNAAAGLPYQVANIKFGVAGGAGANGVSPISVSALPESIQVNLNADGSPASGALPQAIGVSATRAGATSAITSITIVSSSGVSASVSGGQINITGFSGNGEVIFDVISAGQTVRKRVPVTGTPAGSNGALQQVLAITTPQLTWTSYAQHGGTIAINASATGKLKLNLAGNMRVAVGTDDLRFQSKLQYRPAAGTWTDVPGSEAISTKSETLSEPTRVVGANVNGAGPYTLTGLTTNGAYEVRAITRKYDGTASSTATVALSLSAEQVP